MADWNFPKGDLMAGKRGLVMGVANQNSIAWGIAQQLAAQGAEMAFTYQGEALERRVRPLIESIGMDTMISADVTNDDEMDAAFATLKEKYGKLDFVVHAIAYAGKDELKGSMVHNTTREGFARAMDISVFSFIDVCRRASEMMEEGGSIINLTYLGSERVIPSYNVMGVAKAGLEAATRYAARDMGKQGVRVNAISAGPMRTLALMGIKGSKSLMSAGRDMSLLGEDTKMEGVAGAALYLLSPIGASITGEVLHVDAGFHVVGVPEPSEE
ncbi:enoyl-ACP reductase FabI [Hirschia baltica]|uniref:Enoyl-[acyl-carrier-protein] reductase [NADH] n=1 Tax=Hirschia baltica (strain ATCC 49814 / DSM 5838 / IFAM 1418) TaxID=582402 RepID=C6XID7_HIRBI|nr:enoyl-ACP reductase [Hirschia baltica]ACT60744.1 short-chain dehydrogenase/reductase SDR [Hirschia baltica ATCC 49814]